MLRRRRCGIRESSELDLQGIGVGTEGCHSVRYECDHAMRCDAIAFRCTHRQPSHSVDEICCSGTAYETELSALSARLMYLELW